MSNPPLGIGLIGCGNIAHGHAFALRMLTEDGDVRPVTVTDLSAAAVENVRTFCPFERASEDGFAVIEDPDVDAVVIATPTTTHQGFVEAAVAAGKPFLCEKPLATNFATVQSMCDTVAASSLTTQVGFHARFHALTHELHRLVESGELGAPMGYTLRDDQFWPTGDVTPGHSSWRSDKAQAGGGALLEHSIHSADLLCWMFGPATSVYAKARHVFGYDVEDTVVCTIEHASGVIGTLISVFNGVIGREERRLEVFFEQASLEMTTDFMVGAKEDSFLIQRPSEEAVRFDPKELLERHLQATGITRRGFLIYLYPAARDFVAAVRAGRPGWPSFEDARRAHALVDAAYRSVEAGVPADVAG